MVPDMNTPCVMFIGPSHQHHPWHHEVEQRPGRMSPYTRKRVLAQNTPPCTLVT